MSLESILERDDVPEDVKKLIEENLVEQKLKEDTLIEQKLKEDTLIEQKLKEDTLKEKHLSQMMHEIRSPLNIILGFSALLLEENLNSEQESYAKAIKDSGNTMLNFTNSFLDYKKLESGKFPIENQFFNLKDSLDNILYSFKPLADKENINLELIYSDDIPINYFGDKDKINQIITNLVSNAIKYTDEGNVTIEVIKTLEYYSIKVKDTGKGISEENRSKLFQEYSQIEGSNDKYKGSGLGLLICKNLVELLRGDIKVESELGKGSKFSVNLPLEELSILYIDSDETQKIYHNSLFNSLKYNYNPGENIDSFLNLDDNSFVQELKKYNLIVLNKDHNLSNKLVNRIRHTQLGGSIKILGFTSKDDYGVIQTPGYDAMLKAYSNKDGISKTIYNFK